MRQLADATFPELSSWILSREPWIQCALVLSELFFALTTSFSDNQEPETIGLKAIIRKEQN